MNILTHPVHTGYQFDLARTRHEFYSLEIPGINEVFWDEKSRPQPKNYHRLRFSDEPPVKFDLALAHFAFGFHCLKQSDLPLIFKEHCLRPPFEVPTDWMDRITGYSFASQTAAASWQVPAKIAHRKTIIGMGMDLQIYGRYDGEAGGILTVGQNIRSRGNEKGYDNLMRLAQTFSISVVGMGNEGIPGALGPAANYAELQRHYRQNRVFLNPSNILGMSTLEAMATGMPVVCFKMVNSDVIQNGVHGFIVDTVDEAEKALNQLLKNPQLAQAMGRKGRSLIQERFRMDLFVKRWDALFHQAVEEHVTFPPRKKWEPFHIASRPLHERQLAEALTQTVFEYCRVGFDKRKMTFLPNGRIGKGADGCELFWNTKIKGDSCFLEIFSGDTLTCALKRAADGKWHGQWTQFERMPIVLTPIASRGKSET